MNQYESQRDRRILAVTLARQFQLQQPELFHDPDAVVEHVAKLLKSYRKLLASIEDFKQMVIQSLDES